MHIGVDVGGTNTDAALLDGTNVLSSVKSPTTSDIGAGIVNAIGQILKESGCLVEDIECVMIGTTQFTNAFVEGKNLNKVAVFRAALPATQSVMPMVEFPIHLSNPIGKHFYLVKGGYEFDGRLINPLDEEAVAEGAKAIVALGIKSVVVTSVFTPLTMRWKKRWQKLSPPLHRMSILPCRVKSDGLD